MTESPTTTAGLADSLRSHTRSLHRQAERSGILGDLLQGRANRAAYILLLRNLLPAYEAMEAGLEDHRASAVIQPYANAAVYRSAAIRADLDTLAGRDWRLAVPILPSAALYTGRIAAVAADGILLIAHAYVRYLGDLNGGQILKRILGRTLNLGHESLSFYDFRDIADLASFTLRYRSAFDTSGALLGAFEPLLDEAKTAFRFNIDISEAIRRATSPAS